MNINRHGGNGGGGAVSSTMGESGRGSGGPRCSMSPRSSSTTRKRVNGFVRLGKACTGPEGAKWDCAGSMGQLGEFATSLACFALLACRAIAPVTFPLHPTGTAAAVLLLLLQCISRTNRLRASQSTLPAAPVSIQGSSRQKDLAAPLATPTWTQPTRSPSFCLNSQEHNKW